MAAPNFLNPIFETRGGTRSYTNYSGTAGQNVLVWSGAGRLNTILPLVHAASGIPINFFDAPNSLVVSGMAGFAGDSGMPIIGRLPGTQDPLAQVSGAAVDTSKTWNTPIMVEFSFASGLAYSSQSGTPGFSLSFTPVG